MLGGALTLFVLEASRRTVGWVPPAIALAFLLYYSFQPWMPEPFDHRGFSLQRIIGQNALTRVEGLFSTPLDVAASLHHPVHHLRRGARARRRPASSSSTCAFAAVPASAPRPPRPDGRW